MNGPRAGGNGTHRFADPKLDPARHVGQGLLQGLTCRLLLADLLPELPLDEQKGCERRQRQQRRQAMTHQAERGDRFCVLAFKVAGARNPGPQAPVAFRVRRLDIRQA